MKKEKITLEEIKEQEKKLNKLKYKLLDEEYIKKDKPQLEKKFLGNYFKTRNRYSSGKGWWLYCKVIGISKKNSYSPIKYVAFQTMSNEKVEMFIDDNSGSYLSSWHKITKKEFEEAHNIAVNRMKNLNI